MPPKPTPQPPTSAALPARPAVHPSVHPKSIATLLALLSSAIMLALLFPPFYCFFFAPFALVPFCTVILRRPLRPAYIAAYYACGIAFFLPTLWWLAPVTIGGYIALALFVALYFPLFAIALHRLVVQLRLPATIAVPLAWTAVEYLRSTFVEGGFPWFMLGNCLAPVPLFIQTADIFGVWGLTFLIALVNGFIVDLLRLPLRQVSNGTSRLSPVMFRLTGVTTVLVAFSIAYGVFRLNQSTTTPGPRIAVIQENIPQSVKESGNADADIFRRHLQLTRDALHAIPRPDLVAWPETMLPGYGNPEFLNAPDSAFASFLAPIYFLNTHDLSNERFRILRQLSDASDTPLLLGVGSLVPRKDFADSPKQNRTVLVAPGVSPDAFYAKRHLVPFGEYIPFLHVPLVGKYMIAISPIEGIDYSNVSGEEWTRFSLPVKDRLVIPAVPSTATAPTTANSENIFTSTHFYTFATPICFEDAMPFPSRRMSSPQFDPSGLHRKTDFLVNVSNDGWFYSVELDQHLQACQLRAVENRIPIARSVNTGNSGFIDSNGRIIKLVTDARGNSIGAVGTASAQLQIDSRITFYSRIGDLFPITCGITATLLTAWTFVRPRRPAKPSQNP